jgi:hypothetical protein
MVQKRHYKIEKTRKLSRSNMKRDGGCSAQKAWLVLWFYGSRFARMNFIAACANKSSVCKIQSQPVCVRTGTPFTALAQLLFMRSFGSPIVFWSLHPYTGPPLDPESNPLDIDCLVYRKGAQLLTRLAPLIEHDRAVSIASISCYQDGHHATCPRPLFAFCIIAREAAHDTSQVFVVVPLALVALEPSRGHVW